MTHKECFRWAAHVLLLVMVVLALVAIAPAEWKDKVLHSFQGGTDGTYPPGGVATDRAGNLYVATNGVTPAHGADPSEPLKE